MHELSIAMSIVDIAAEYAARDNAKCVTEIEIEVGTLAGVVIDALDFAMEAAIKNTKQFCDEQGITEKAIKVGNKINEGKKTFTGEKASEDVNKFLNLQNCYNDLVATKLEEALKRIEVLEQRLDKEE